MSILLWTCMRMQKLSFVIFRRTLCFVLCLKERFWRELVMQRMIKDGSCRNFLYG